jgi:hypothetical protein
MQYIINRATAIYDVIDGDIVIIHLENGNYYNLSGSGALIWQHIAKNTSFERLLTNLTSIYNAESAKIENDLKNFLANLKAEGLVLQQPHNENSSLEDNPLLDESEKRDYFPPKLDIFTDMQDFLLVDPIHEVDEQGLPKYTPQKQNND